MRQRALVAALAALLVGGSLLSRTATAADGMLPDEWQGFRTAPLLLLSRPDVRAELRLDEAQTAAAQQAIANLRAQAAALRGKTGPGMAEARKKIDEAQYLWIERHLSIEQRGRLDQIDLQWEGPSALISRPIVADTLRLTAEQRYTLGQAVAAYQKKRFSGAPALETLRELDARATAVLSRNQKALWWAMLGDRFGSPAPAIVQRGAKPGVDPGVRPTGHDQP